MQRGTAIASLMLAALVGCATTAPTPALSGEWAPQDAQLGGKPFPLAAFRGAHLVLTLDSYDFAGDKGAIEVLPGDAKPARMDIKGREGPNAGRTIPAIYKLEGDTLTVCYQLGKGERPADFVSPAGTQVLLIRYQRVVKS